MGTNRVLIPVMLAALAIAACDMKRSDTEAVMIGWSNALKLHLATDFEGYNQFPKRLEDVDPLLRTGLDTVDAWGNGLHYRRVRDDLYDLISFGPDGVPGNEDDVVFTNGKIKKPMEIYAKRPIRPGR